MKQYARIVGVFILIIVLGAYRTSAQQNDFVGVEIRVKKEVFSHKAKVPVLSQEPVGPNGDPSEVYIGSWATVDCLNCPLSSEYSIFGQAVRTDVGYVELILDVKFKNRKKCNITGEELSIKRDKPLKLKKKCGVEIFIEYPTLKDIVR